MSNLERKTNNIQTGLYSLSRCDCITENYIKAIETSKQKHTHAKCEKILKNFNRIRPSLWRFRHIDVKFCILKPLKRGLSLTNLKDKMKRLFDTFWIRTIENSNTRKESRYQTKLVHPSFGGREHTTAAFIAGNDDWLSHEKTWSSWWQVWPQALSPLLFHVPCSATETQHHPKIMFTIKSQGTFTSLCRERE